MGKDNCTPYPPSITSDSEMDPTQHIRCTHPTRLTDSNTGPNTYTEDTAADVYISGNNPEQILFIFSTPVSITAINILYYSNTEDQGHPKIRIYAVPEDFNVWDTADSSCPSIFIDEAPPGSEETGLRNVTREAGFETTRVLLTKSESKNYNFVISEVEFFTCDPGKSHSITMVPSIYDINHVTVRALFVYSLHWLTICMLADMYIHDYLHV